MDSAGPNQPRMSIRNLGRSNSCTSIKKLDSEVPLQAPTDVLPLSSTKEKRHNRLKSLLTEAKKEEPLGKCYLFKMPLTFQLFVWAPNLEVMYTTHNPPVCKSSVKLQLEGGAPPISGVVKPFLSRSNSATSFRLLVNPITSPAPLSKESSCSVSADNGRKKDLVRLSMLSPGHSSPIKLKSVKDSRRCPNEILTVRSLKLGAVPRYLTNRKEEWAQKERDRIRNLPDPNCPAGHIPMPESERLETLATLQNNQKEMLEELNCLPVSKDTLRIRQRKESIEQKLNKVEEGIRILSKPKVFVKIDT